jgi:DNA-binding NarL/FixJ family response regulator
MPDTPTWGGDAASRPKLTLEEARDRRVRILSLLAEGRSLREVGRIMGMSRARVAYIRDHEPQTPGRKWHRDSKGESE